MSDSNPRERNASVNNRGQSHPSQKNSNEQSGQKTPSHAPTDRNGASVQTARWLRQSADLEERDATYGIDHLVRLPAFWLGRAHTRLKLAECAKTEDEGTAHLAAAAMYVRIAQRKAAFSQRS